MGQSATEGKVIVTSNDGTDLADAKRLMDLTDHDVLGDGISPQDFGPLVLQILQEAFAPTAMKLLICLHLH